MPNGGPTDVKWIAPERPTYVLPPTPELEDEKRERTKSLVVTVLSLACAGFALFDLFLFAWRV